MRATTSVSSRRRHKRVIKAAKGYRSIGKRFKTAKQAVMKAGINAYRGRKEKKRVMRRLWITRISNALRGTGVNYSTFIDAVSKKGITVNRKMISEIAVTDMPGFEALLKEVGLDGGKKAATKSEAKPKAEKKPAANKATKKDEEPKDEVKAEESEAPVEEVAEEAEAKEEEKEEVAA